MLIGAGIGKALLSLPACPLFPEVEQRDRKASAMAVQITALLHFFILSAQ